MGPSGHFTRMWTRCGRCELFKTGCHVFGTCCILGRDPCIKETLRDFHEWCQVTRHPRMFRGLTGCQWDLKFWGVTKCPAPLSVPQKT